MSVLALGIGTPVPLALGMAALPFGICGLAMELNPKHPLGIDLEKPLGIGLGTSFGIDFGKSLGLRS